MDFTILDIAIGTIFIYLLLSLFASTIMELIATWFEFRADTLERAVKRMLDDGGSAAISKLFYGTAAIKYLGDTKGKNEDKKPSYLMPNNFSKAVMDVIIDKSSGKKLTLTDIQNGLAQLKTDNPGSKVSVEYIETLLRDSENNIDKLRSGLEQWFNDTMDRTNGWYKKKIQYWLLAIGFLIAIAFNADTIQIVKYLNDNPKERAEMVEHAKVYIQKHDSEVKDTINKVALLSSDALERADGLLKKATSQQNNIMAQTGSAIGWPNGIWDGLCNSLNIEKAIGFLLTSLAISLGSTFWFDLLKKVINIRGAGVNPDEKKDDKAKATS